MLQSTKLYNFIFVILAFSAKTGFPQPETVTYNQKIYPLYPHLLAERPAAPSPFVTADGAEFLVVGVQNRKYAIVPVTVENGEPWLHARQRGKGNQLQVDAGDFPTLAWCGVHAALELEQTRMITGRSVAEITTSGRPGCASGAGFLAQDEDIISVLLADNQLVKKLDLTHPQLAKPLFHLFNVIRLHGAEHGAKPELIRDLYYNGKTIHLTGCHSGKGWQESIFNDEILGFYQFDLFRNLDAEEKRFLALKYPHLTENEMTDFIQRLTSLHTGEMVAFYIMRYGFYEGHTDYRADPVAVACLFGLKKITEIEAAFPGKLPGVLTRHFTQDAPKIGE